MRNAEAEAVRFSAKCVLCKYDAQTKSYTASWDKITSRQDVRDKLGTDESTLSIHLPNKISIYANPDNFSEHIETTARVLDRDGNPHFWYGDFLIVAHNGKIPVDIDVFTLTNVWGTIFADIEHEGLYESEDF